MLYNILSVFYGSEVFCKFVEKYGSNKNDFTHDRCVNYDNDLDYYYSQLKQINYANY